MTKDIKDITYADLSKFDQDLINTPASTALARSVQENGVVKASMNYDAKRSLNRVFSLEVETGTVTAQKKSGRCWLFATLNTLRHEFAKKYKMKDFQFSQNYNSFFDRLEKANHYLEEIIRLADRPADDRELLEVLNWNDNDGGQWANAAALINKYGVVPQSVMPETFTSDQTADLNSSLNLKLSKDAMALREMKANGKSDDDLRAYKKEALSEVYRMLVYAFGKPVEKFDFEYRDDDKKYHLDKDLTPKEFYDKYVARDFDDYVCLLDAPDHEMGKKYGLPSQDYIYDGKHIEFLNVGTSSLKQAVIESLKASETVWFGCDVLQDLDRQKGYLAPEFFKQGDLFNIDLNLSKKERLASRNGEVSHAMTFTGVDLVDGKPTKWKVENSWGDKVGDKGYFIMSDEWFDKYVYEVIVNQKYISSEAQKINAQAKTDLPAWDSLR
ncbi:aminopeptidase C [Ligilactobacillus sp. LYQ135]